MSLHVFGLRSDFQNPRRCSRGSPRSSRRRRRRYVIFEKAMAFFLVRLGDQPGWFILPRILAEQGRTRQLHPLPRDDSNSRYRLCFARRRPRLPVAGAVAACADETTENFRPPRPDKCQD